MLAEATASHGFGEAVETERELLVTRMVESGLVTLKAVLDELARSSVLRTLKPDPIAEIGRTFGIALNERSPRDRLVESVITTARPTLGDLSWHRRARPSATTPRNGLRGRRYWGVTASALGIERAPPGPRHNDVSSRSQRHWIPASAGMTSKARFFRGVHQTHFQVVGNAGNAAWCTPATARPDGSAALANDASHAIAAGDEHAIDLPPGTVAAQAAPGNWRSKMRR